MSTWRAVRRLGGGVCQPHARSIIATLAGVGYKAAAEAVSEMAGFEVREVEQPPM